MKSKLALALIGFVALTALCASAQTPQKSFDTMKSLTGTWVGKDPTGSPMDVTYRVTSGGSALLGELKKSMQGGAEDMISMINLDGDRLLLTHYCTAGNQPRMSATASPDGKTITFTMVDATNLPNPQAMHMGRVVFTFVDPNHHTEDWQILDHGKEMIGHLEFERKN